MAKKGSSKVQFGSEGAADIFARLHKKASAADIRRFTKKSIDWYRTAIENLARSNFSRSKLINDDVRRAASPFIGNMFFFKYDPKWKVELPYYDVFPIVAPFTIEADRFRGINLHYLPLSLRVKGLKILYDLRNNKFMDERTKLQISWAVLKQFSVFRPCVKEYLFTHVRSSFVSIGAEDYAAAALMPVADFKKKSQADVWKDSKRKIRGFSK